MALHNIVVIQYVRVTSVLKLVALVNDFDAVWTTIFFMKNDKMVLKGTI